MNLEVGLLVVLLVTFQANLSQAQDQITFGDVARAIGAQAKDCFSSRVDRVRAVCLSNSTTCLQSPMFTAKALTSVIQGNLGSQNTKLKCSSKCVLQNFGLMSPNGTLSVDSMRKLAEKIPVAKIKGIVLDRIDLCVEDAEIITDSCQKSATVTMCVAKNGVLTVTSLPKTLMDGFKLLPKLLQDRIGLSPSSQTSKRKP